MSFQTVTIDWDEADPALAGATGTITFLLSTPLHDPVGGEDANTVPKTYSFSGSGQSDPLVANDSSGITPTGSYYTITVGTVGAAPYSFQAQILAANGSTQNLASLVPLSAPPALVSSLPLPSGVPQAGQVPVATGSGESSAWGPGAPPLPLSISSGGTGQATQQAALDALAGTQAAAQYLRGNGTHVAMSAVQAADLPTGTTGTKGALQLDGTAADIQPAGSAAAAGANGLAADSGHTHPAGAYLPADIGLLAANLDDPATAATNGITIAGTVYLLKILIRKAITASKINVAVTTVGNNTGGSTGTYVGLYNSSGTLLSGSSDVATSLTSGGLVGMSLTSSQSLSAGTFVWAAILTNMGTTQPTLARTSTGLNVINTGLVAATYRVCVNGTSQTSLSSITPSSNTQTNSLGFYVGLS
jgi:hypothetical protein